MEKFEIGDLVVLASGSMRMAVEAVDEGRVACVWCHEGEIGRDAFDARLLKKWEYREEERPARAEGGAASRSAATREGGGKPYRAERDDDKPPAGQARLGRQAAREEVLPQGRLSRGAGRCDNALRRSRWPDEFRIMQIMLPEVNGDSAPCSLEPAARSDARRRIMQTICRIRAA